jgi:hypothetical protein
VVSISLDIGFRLASKQAIYLESAINRIIIFIVVKTKTFIQAFMAHLWRHNNISKVIVRLFVQISTGHALANVFEFLDIQHFVHCLLDFLESSNVSGKVFALFVSILS